MESKDILNYINSFTTDEKMIGYCNILHHALIDIRADRLEGASLRDFAHVTHEMPTFLARNLKGFSDEWFWTKASAFPEVEKMMLSWFHMGVSVHTLKKEIFEKRAEG